MTITEAVISGIVQGLTEFLPVSSSGHLVFVHEYFGFTGSSIFFDICLHVATLMAVILYFRKDIISLFVEKRKGYLLYIAIGSIPAIAAALLFEDRIAGFFTSPVKVAGMLVVTAFILMAGQLCLWNSTRSRKPVTWYSSLGVGIAQAFALLPGISRSGITISAALVGGIKADEAFRFSFLLSIPVIAGAAVYKLLFSDAMQVVTGNLPVYVAGMVTAFIAGILSLRLLWWIISKKRLYIFAIYCFVLGLTGILLWK